MKKVCITALGLFVVTVACTQKTMKNKDGIPEPVKTAFAKKFPNVKGAKWEKEDANFEAAFEVNEVETSVVYNATGSLLETETEIDVTKLPEAAKTYLESNYKGQKVKEAAEIVDASGTKTYEAEVKGKDIIFDANGAFIRVSL